MTKYSSWVRFLPERERPDLLPRRSEPAFVAESRKDGIFIDWGLPIPDRYDCTYLRLMVQSPYRLFTYWEIGGAEAARLGNQGTPYSIRLMVCNLTDGDAFPLFVGAASEWWLHVHSDCSYRIQLEAVRPDGEVTVLAVSNEVRTPRDTVSWEVEPYELLQPENARYLQLLTYSGAEPADAEFLEMMKQCESFDRFVLVPEHMLRFLPEWLRDILRKMGLRIPRSLFLEFVLRRYFPEALHARLLAEPGMSPEDFEHMVSDYVSFTGTSLSFYREREHILPSSPGPASTMWATPQR